LYESTEINFTGTTELSELWFLSLTHIQTLTSEGTTLTVIGSHTGTEPGSNLEVFDVEGDSDAVSIAVAHPVIRTRSENLSVAGGFDYRNATTTILDVVDSRDRIRSVFVGGTYDFIDQFRGISLVGVELRQGLDILDATETGSANLSRAGGHSDFTKVTAVALRNQTLGPGWSVSAALKGQYAFDELLATEECGLGGEEFGSAYDAYELSGDHCLAGRVELQYGAASENEFVESYEIYGFYDLGAVWHIDGSNRDDRESLASAGFGGRANMIEDIWGSVELAMPLTRSPTVDRDDGEKNPRIFFSLTKRF
jgi:hemolysin activation/secretion protein